MPWQECDRMVLRREFVELASAEGSNVAGLCRRFGISRKTGYKWLSRWRAEGEAGLAERSRRPRSCPQQTPLEVERAVLAVRSAHPSWGGRKIHHVLKRQGMAAPPSASTVTRVLDRHGLIDPDWKLERGPWQRFERAEPNELWQMDFKGEWRTEDGRWCYPLTVLDDHSRYNLVLRACVNQKRLTVKRCLVDAFRTYGIPRGMLMDNGVPWSSSLAIGGWTKLSVWLLRQDIKVSHGRPYHPQTQGKEERFHGTLKVELLQGRRWLDCDQVQRDLDPWREVYNFERPHEALGFKVPGDRYRPSVRDYREALPAIEYGPGETVRKVNPVGQVSFRGTTYKFSQAFGGEPVAIRPTLEDGLWDVVFVRQRIGQIDERSGVVVARPGSGRCAPAAGPGDEAEEV